MALSETVGLKGKTTRKAFVRPELNLKGVQRKNVDLVCHSFFGGEEQEEAILRGIEIREIPVHAEKGEKGGLFFFG